MGTDAKRWEEPNVVVYFRQVELTGEPREPVDGSRVWKVVKKEGVKLRPSYFIPFLLHQKDTP